MLLYPYGPNNCINEPKRGHALILIYSKMVKKSTKKFQKSHLKRTIDQRKQVQNYKKKVLNDKRKHGRKANAETPDYKHVSNLSQSDTILEENTESFFSKDIDGLEALKNANAIHSKRVSSKAGRQPDSQDEDLSDTDNFKKYLDQEDQDALLSDDDESQMSEASIEEVDSDEDDILASGNRKKNSGGKEEITKEHVEKWSKLLTEDNSLRALRPVTVAFKTAVNVGVDEPERVSFKYSITDPEGISDLFHV